MTVALAPAAPKPASPAMDPNETTPIARAQAPAKASCCDNCCRQAGSIVTYTACSIIAGGSGGLLAYGFYASDLLLKISSALGVISSVGSIIKESCTASQTDIVASAGRLNKTYQSTMTELPKEEAAVKALNDTPAMADKATKAWQDERTKYIAQVKDLADKLEASNKRIDDLVKQIETFTQRERELNTSLSSLGKKIDTILPQADEQAKTMAALNTQLQTNTAAQQKNDQLFETDAKALVDRITTLMNAFQERVDKHAQAEADLKAEMLIIDARNKEMGQKNTESELKLKQFTDQVAELESVIARQKEESSKLREQLIRLAPYLPSAESAPGGPNA